MNPLLSSKLYQYATVWYSDDGGRSYNHSQTLLDGMNESELVEAPDGQILAAMRNRKKYVGLSVSSDGGKTFSNVTYDHNLISPVS